MKWTVLSDNRAKDPSLQTEHGLSILLETGRHRILLDAGASDVLSAMRRFLADFDPQLTDL